MYRKYYSYNDMPIPVKKENSEHSESKPALENISEEKPAPPAKYRSQSPEKNTGLLSKLKSDDMILLLIILILLLDECDDKLLLAAIAFVFFSGTDN